MSTLIEVFIEKLIFFIYRKLIYNKINGLEFRKLATSHIQHALLVYIKYRYVQRNVRMIMVTFVSGNFLM